MLTHNAHTGPLRVQKALYPEAQAAHICHAVVVHPPAGVAGGDELAVSIVQHAHTHAVLSTPGATQWYKTSAQTPATMSVQLRLAEHAKLDWLPQENILFDASHVRLHTELDLAPSASAIGWDVCVLGRSAKGETWQHASLVQRSRITRGGQALWIEHSDLNSQHPLCNNTAALANHRIMGTLWAVGGRANSELAQAVAVDLPYTAHLKAGVTCLNDTQGGIQQGTQPSGGVMLLRVLGDDMQAVRACLVDAWTKLRPLIHAADAVPLRLWAM